jgi:hypothetical protein
MTNLLCQFSHSFPLLAADILEREKHTRRNFREETITDLLMAGLTAFKPFGVHVYFPDETKTGSDMDWEFVAPRAGERGRYLHLRIQAKRAIQTKSKSPYWYYRELAHESPKGAGKGSQAQTLVNSAIADGAVPLYIFYHPASALDSSKGNLPAIEGVNLMLAHHVPVKATAPWFGCYAKRVEAWRPDFLSLSDLLCFGGTRPGFAFEDEIAYFMFLRRFLTDVQPGKIAEMLETNYQRRLDRESVSRSQAPDHDRQPIEAKSEIPEATKEILERGGLTPEESQMLPRPRIIFAL